VREPQAFATELHRVLSDAGMALVTVPFVFQDHQDYWRPTKRTLGNLFRQYSSVRIYAQGTRLHTILDLLTTAFSPYPFLLPLRLLLQPQQKAVP